MVRMAWLPSSRRNDIVPEAGEIRKPIFGHADFASTAAESRGISRVVAFPLRGPTEGAATVRRQALGRPAAEPAMPAAGATAPENGAILEP